MKFIKLTDDQASTLGIASKEDLLARLAVAANPVATETAAEVVAEVKPTEETKPAEKPAAAEPSEEEKEEEEEAESSEVIEDKTEEEEAKVEVPAEATVETEAKAEPITVEGLSKVIETLTATVTDLQTKLTVKSDISAAEVRQAVAKETIRAVAATGVAPIAVAQPNEPAASDLYERYNAITDPAEKSEFWNLHRSQMIQAAFTRGK